MLQQLAARLLSELDANVGDVGEVCLVANVPAYFIPFSEPLHLHGIRKLMNMGANRDVDYYSS